MKPLETSLSNNANWIHHNPVSIRFGVGARRDLAARIENARILIVTTKRGRQQIESDNILGPIVSDADALWMDNVTPNPGLSLTQTEIDRLSNEAMDCVVAFGGGSAMDTAKALAAALAPGLSTRDLATIIADPARHLSRAVLPLFAITTTSGTGAEVTPFATIWNEEARKKLSLASPWLYPEMAIVDPELTYGLPHHSTIATGLDALNQAFESVWNRNRTPVTTAMAARAIGLALEALPALHTDSNDHEARATMAEGSVLAGFCISQTRTAICHSISYPLTAHFSIDHGLACAATMSSVARRVLELAPEGMNDVSRMIGLPGPDALVEKLDRVLVKSGFASLIAPNLPEFEAILALKGEMFTPGRSDNFILPISPDDLEAILRDSRALMRS